MRGPQGRDPTAPVLRQTSGASRQHWARDRACGCARGLGRGQGPRPHLLVPAGQMRCLAAQLQASPAELTLTPTPAQSRAWPAGVSPGAPVVAWGRGRQPLPSIPEILAGGGNRGWAAGPQARNRRPLFPGSFLLTSSRGEVGLAQEGEQPCLPASGWGLLGASLC